MVIENGQKIADLIKFELRTISKTKSKLSKMKTNKIFPREQNFSVKKSKRTKIGATNYCKHRKFHVELVEMRFDWNLQ